MLVHKVHDRMHAAGVRVCLGAHRSESNLFINVRSSSGLSQLNYLTWHAAELLAASWSVAPPPPLKWDSRRLQTACVHLKLNQGLILNRHFDKSHIIQDTSRHAKWENLITPLTPSKGITAFTYIWSANPKNSNIQLDANIYACIRFFFFWYWFYSKVIFESVLWCDVALRCIISYLFLKCAFFVCVQPNPAHMKTKLFSVGEEIPQRPGS